MINNIIESRLLICIECPFINVETCTACGCDLNKKSRDLNEKCPLNPPKWDSNPNINFTNVIDNLSIVEQKPSTECKTCPKGKKK